MFISSDITQFIAFAEADENQERIAAAPASPEEVKPGDLVIAYRFNPVYPYYKFHTVSKVTKTQITIDDGIVFSKNSSTKIGDGGASRPLKIRYPNKQIRNYKGEIAGTDLQSIIEGIKADIEADRRKRLIRSLNEATDGSLRHLSTEDIENVLKFIEGKAAAVFTDKSQVAEVEIED